MNEKIMVSKQFWQTQRQDQNQPPGPKKIETWIIYGHDNNFGHKSRVQAIAQKEHQQRKQPVKQDAVDHCALWQANPRILCTFKNWYRIQCR